MPWQDRQLTAAYNDIQIFIESFAITGGQKGVISDYPQRNGGSAETLGIKQKTISVNAFVYGENYDQTAALLERAFDTPGRGILTIPTSGEYEVLITSWSRTDRPDKEGGRAVFKILGVEHKVDSSPIITGSVSIDTSRIVELIDSQRAAISEVTLRNSQDTIALVIPAITEIKSALREIVSQISSGISALTGDFFSTMRFIFRAAATVGAVATGIAGLLSRANLSKSESAFTFGIITAAGAAATEIVAERSYRLQEEIQDDIESFSTIKNGIFQFIDVNRDGIIDEIVEETLTLITASTIALHERVRTLSRASTFITDGVITPAEVAWKTGYMPKEFSEFEIAEDLTPSNILLLPSEKMIQIK